MKKIIILLLLCFLGTQFANAQNKKIYVSKQGGKPKLMRFGKICYDEYHYTNNSETCDTLICRGSGFEVCKLDKNVYGRPVPDTKYYEMFNSAIHKAEKHIKKTNTKEGNLALVVNGAKLNVKYYNADKKGNADIEIEVL